MRFSNTACKGSKKTASLTARALILDLTLNGPVSHHWHKSKLVTWYKLKVRESCFCNGANLNLNAYKLLGLRLEDVFYIYYEMFLRYMFPFGEDIRLQLEPRVPMKKSALIYPKTLMCQFILSQKGAKSKAVWVSSLAGGLKAIKKGKYLGVREFPG